MGVKVAGDHEIGQGEWMDSHDPDMPDLPWLQPTAEGERFAAKTQAELDALDRAYDPTLDPHAPAQESDLSPRLSLSVRAESGETLIDGERLRCVRSLTRDA